MKNKALIIGSGLSGAITARELAENGYDVTIWERRDHIAGNMYDYYDEHGIPVHKYGPHTFHTNDEEVFKYIKRFGEWDEYHLKCGAMIDGTCTPTPFNFTTIDQFYAKDEAEKLKAALKQEYPGRTTVTVLEVMSSSNPLIKGYGEFLFKKDYSLYTAKQWGLDPKDIDPSILKRVPLRLDHEEGYFEDKYQVMPKTLYVDWFKELLNHPNIIVKLGVEALERVKIKAWKIYVDGSEYHDLLIYTGALDELFEYEFGKLPYRSLKFEFKHTDRDNIQQYAVVAHPAHPSITRIVDFKQMYPNNSYEGSTYEEEYPLQYSKDENKEPYYPILTEESQKTYQKYFEKAKCIPNLKLCGRLALFKYINMDQCVKTTLEEINR